MGRSFFANRLTVLLSFLLLSHGCGNPSEADSHARAVAIWEKNEAIVARATEGILVNDEFENSCEFFAELTGIEIRGDGSYVGWTANGYTRQDLEKVRNWYRDNGSRLYWDSKNQEVKLIP